MSDRPEILNLGCGEDHHSDAHNVDAVAAVQPDEVVDLNDTPWPWPDESFTRIQAYHVLEHLESVDAALRECARVLRPGGRLETRWPVGLDAIADPDHRHVWTWRTPEFYCGARHWDTDVGLRVVERDVELWPAGQENPLAALDKLGWWLRRWYDGPGPWCFNQSGACGEFTVVFEKAEYRTPWNE